MRIPLSTCALSAVLLAAAFADCACDEDRADALAPKFDAERAWTHLEGQVALGPRPSGTAAAEKCRAYIEAQLTSYGLQAKRETFKDKTPAGEIEFTNVYADFASADPKATMVIVGSHFDTKRMKETFVGANDGASSTAVLLELSRLIASGGKRPITYRFLFLDGEEAVNPEWRDPDNTYGSRFHAAALKKSGMNKQVRAFVLLDMVGDKDLHVNGDTYSDRRLQGLFFEAARKNGLGGHVDGRREEIHDDHLSFMAVGIPSLDLIDLDYGPANGFWHTDKDVPANCSKESLSAIGRIVLLGLGALESDESAR
jgi:glutaminyl-peptide cyclotransferase